jgi:hypothetical protein
VSFKNDNDLASNHKASADSLRKLYNNKAIHNYSMQIKLAKNPACPEDVLEKLCESKDLARYAASNPACPKHVIRNLLELCVPCCTITDRRAWLINEWREADIIDAICNNPALDSDIAGELISNVNVMALCKEILMDNPSVPKIYKAMI